MLKQKNGLSYKSLCIDPHKSPKEKHVFFTHAHSDHIKLSKHSDFFGTIETIDLVKKRFQRKYEMNFTPIPFNSKYAIDGTELVLEPNGHILGSTQIKISADKEYGITSDFRLQDSLLFKGAKPIDCDTLVLETTFGSPQYVFPDQKEVTDEFIAWVEKEARSNLVVLAGYSLGKAQELTKISNLAGFTPLVHESIFEMNEIYKAHGKDVGNYELLDHNIKEFSVLIIPPQLINRFLLATLKEFDSRKIVSAIATGWAYARGFDKLFSLSNHADYNDLIEYVKLANPKLVLTDHGQCEEFSRKLNRLGFRSKPLKQHKQQVLFDF
jgi:Cft2 family RNA processing exonuclease